MPADSGRTRPGARQTHRNATSHQAIATVITMRTNCGVVE